MQITQSIYEDWVQMHKAFVNNRILASWSNNKSITKQDNVTKDKACFIDRWLQELYSEMTMLTARMLAECGMYELLLQVARAGCYMMDMWMTWWGKSYKRTNTTNILSKETHWTFNPRMTRYHHTSFYSWKAFATYHIAFDETTKQRCLDDNILQAVLGNRIRYVTSPNQSTNTASTTEIIKQIVRETNRNTLSTQLQRDITEARKHIYYHPLSMYMQAKIYELQGLYSEAVSEYEGLIDLISPYDPKRQINSGQTPIGDYAPQEPLSESSLRTRMYYMERVCGRQQFYGIIDTTRIHMEIAEVYVKLDEPSLRVQHLLNAVRESSYDDLDFENFLRLANQLNNIERYPEALAIIEAAQYPNQRLGEIQISYTRHQTPEILKCIIQSRARNFANATEDARLVATRFTLKVDSINKADDLPKDEGLWKLYTDCTSGNVVATGKDELAKLFASADIIVKKYAEQAGTLEAYARTLDDVNESLEYSNERGNLSDIAVDMTQNTSLRFENETEQRKKRKSSSASFFTDWFTPDHKYLDNNLLKIFYAMQSSHKSFNWAIYDDAAKKSRISLSPISRKYAFEHILPQLSQSKVNPFRVLLLSQMVMYHSREYSNKLSQFSELCNNLAYNRAQTGLYLENAYDYSIVAVVTMNYLLHTAETDSKPRHTFSRKLAQFCDTAGWVRYRYYHTRVANKADWLRDAPQPYVNEAQLQVAEKFLMKGIRYDQRRAIIHYHLARLYLTRVEVTWQHQHDLLGNKMPLSFDEKYHDGTEPAKNVQNYAHFVSTSITQAFRYLRNAKELNRFGRLHAQLSWLTNRINLYKKAWEKRQFRGIAGDEDAESPIFEAGNSSAD
jgi:hypothetical protein